MKILANHIATFNVGLLTHPRGHEAVAEFVDNAPKVNAVAERSKGFVWRCVDDDGAVRSEGVNLFDGDPRLAFTLSVWETVEDFEHFVHKTIHNGFLGRRAKWFIPLEMKTYVMWKIPVGHIPSLREGIAKLEQLRAHGASDEHFDFQYSEQRK